MLENMKEMNPRWKFDCGHCKLSWSCGPVCACDHRVKAKAGQKWFPVMGLGNNMVSDNKWVFRNGISVAEVKFSKLAKGERVQYRLGNRDNKDELIQATRGWENGVLTKVTNRWRGKVWGFKVLTIRRILK